MDSVVEQRRHDLVRVCARYHVRRLDLFGSAAREDFDPARSDLDFLVEFEPAQVRGLEQYFGLKEALEALFQRRVDLVEASAVENPYVQAGIYRSRKTLYAA